jgi:hypothetical protein
MNFDAILVNFKNRLLYNNFLYIFFTEGGLDLAVQTLFKELVPG